MTGRRTRRKLARTEPSVALPGRCEGAKPDNLRGPSCDERAMPRTIMHRRLTSRGI